VMPTTTMSTLHVVVKLKNIVVHTDSIDRLVWTIVIYRHGDNLCESIRYAMVFLRGTNNKLGVSELSYVVVPPQANRLYDEAVGSFH
jgi:hypothetical protein